MYCTEIKSKSESAFNDLSKTVSTEANWIMSTKATEVPIVQDIVTKNASFDDLT